MWRNYCCRRNSEILAALEQAVITEPVIELVIEEKPVGEENLELPSDGTLNSA